MTNRLLHRHGRNSLPLVTGGAIIGSYVLFAVLAALRFPRAYGPWEGNTLSQLGNVHLNPNGYMLYLVGCALAGLFTIAFFFTLTPWNRTGRPGWNRVFFAVRLLGVVGGIALFMNAVFPENDYALHHFWAGLVFNSFAAAALLAVPLLWKRGRANLGLVAFNVGAVIAVVLMFVFAPVHWMEWPPAAFLLLFPLVLVLLRRTMAADEAASPS